MIVILDSERSSSDYDNDAVVVSSIEDMERLNGVFDALIIGSYTLGKMDVTALNELKKCLSGFPKVVYVRKEEDTDKSLETLVRGVDGVIESNTDYLGSTQGIKRLARGENYNAVAVTDNISVLKEFSDTFEGGKINRGQQLILSNALQEVIKGEEENKRTLTRTTGAYLGVLTTAQESVESIRKRSADLKKKIADINKLIQNVRNSESSSAVRTIGNVITMYPSFELEHIPSRLTIILKDLGRTPYLTSFAVGFAQYLSATYARDTKVVFLEPAGYLYELRYPSDVTLKQLFITQSNVQSTSDRAVITPIVHTNYPMRENIHNIISRPEYTGLILVDRLLTDVQPLIRVDGIRPVYAASSQGWFSLRNRDLPWFTSGRSREDEGAMGYIPTFRDYSKLSVIDREGAYASPMVTKLYEDVITLSGNKR